MNRLWTFLIVVAIIVMIAMIGYQFYVSVTGGNVTFSASVVPISSDLGVNELKSFQPLTQNQPIKDDSLNNK